MEFDKNRIKTKIAISKIKEENDIAMDNKVKNIIKTVSTAVASVVLCTGVVFASTKVYEVYEKIWKTPKSYTYDEMIAEMPQEITDEEKKELISEDEAKNIGLDILNKLGYENQEINRIELKRGYDDDISSYYMVKTKWGYEEGLMVQINAYSGDFICFQDMDLKYKHLPTEVLSDKEISEIAKDYYSKLELEENLYLLTETKVNDFYFQNQGSKLLSATFNKYYDGLANKYESVNISFISSNESIYLNTIIVYPDSSFQNNDVIISQDEAITIAQNKEKEFSNYDITNVEAKLSIEKMNAFIYAIENNTFNQEQTMEERTYYKTDNITRKVWKVKVEHGFLAKDFGIDRKNEYYKEGMSKYYFIDATTGEIIGGENVNRF